MSLWIKICGTTSTKDALLAVEAGADAVGFVFAPSPRQVTATQAAAITSQLPKAIEKIGVFVDASLAEIVSTVQACSLTGVQLHFEAKTEFPERLHKSLGPGLRILRVMHFSASTAEQHAAEFAAHAGNQHIDAVLLDSRSTTAVGGTGVSFDWTAARESLFKTADVRMRLVAAGGLTPANVADAIATLDPWGVDAVSGVEAAPGRKDAAKVREFIARVRSGDVAFRPSLSSTRA